MRQRSPDDADEDRSPINERSNTTDETLPAPLSETLPAPPSDTLPAPRPLRWDAARLPVVDPRGYAVTGEVAHGGNGRVLRAQDRHLDRTVALKELLERGGESEERFVREALITAKLQHPSIVPIYQAGRWPSGEPFYAMKLVSGRTLAELIDESKTLDQRLALLAHVLAAAEAVAYAHSKRIIHRDLKPANVLVGEFGETVVIDWGLAKDLAGEKPSLRPPPPTDPMDLPEALAVPDDGLTVAGSVMGTPSYMPPEQASARPVDERADVYALGAILYHVLAGRVPYEGDSVLRILLRIRAESPPPLASQQAGIPRDLVTIVEKAMAREPSARYPTGREIAEDLRRFMTGQIVGAHEYSALELVRRAVRRYRAPLSVAAAALGLLLVLGTLGMRRITTERDQARSAQREAARRADELTVMEARASLDRDPVRALALLKDLSPDFPRTAATRFIAESAAEQGIPRVLRGHTQAVNLIAFSPHGRTLATASDDHTVRLWDSAPQPGPVRAIKVLLGSDELWRVAFSPDGRWLAAVGKDRSVKLWDTVTSEARTLPVAEAGLWELAFSPDSKTLAAAGNGHEIAVWDTASGAPRSLGHHSDLIWEIAFSPDSQWLASVSKDGSLGVWGVHNGQQRILTGHNGDIHALAVSPDGHHIATGGKDRTVRLWSPAGSEGHVLTGHTDAVFAVAFSPDNKTLASAGLDGNIRLWDVATGSEKQVLPGHEGRVWKIAFSPDGQWLASAGADRTARLVDLASGDSRVLRGFEALVFSVVFSPDSRILAAASHDHTVRLYDLPIHAHRALPSEPGHRVVFSPDGTRLCVAGAENALLFDLASGGPSIALPGDAGALEKIVFSPDGGIVAGSFAEGIARLWDLAGRPLRVLGTQAGTPLAFSPDGARLAYAGPGGAVHLGYVDAATAQVFSGHAGAVLDLAFSPNGQIVASSGTDGTVRLWDVETGRQRILRGHEGPVPVVAFSPDGRTLASGGKDHTLRLWDVASGEGRRVDTGGFGASELTFTPDGASVISLDGGMESSVRIWDVKTGETRKLLGGHEDAVIRFALSPGGKRLATASHDRTVRLWDLATGESRVFRGHPAPALDVAFSPDGATLASVSEAGAALLWSDDLPEDRDALRAYIQSATPEVVDIESP